jgi:hypothetical protein
MKALIIGLAIIIGCNLTPGAGRSERMGTTRTELQRHDLSAPGREVVQVRSGRPNGQELEIQAGSTRRSAMERYSPPTVDRS